MQRIALVGDRSDNVVAHRAIPIVGTCGAALRGRLPPLVEAFTTATARGRG
jgi:hypothetical protein